LSDDLSVVALWSLFTAFEREVLADWFAEVLGVVAAAWFESTAVVLVAVLLELVAVLWFEFISLEAVDVVAGAVAAGAALLSTFVALVEEVTGGVALLAVVAALLPGFAVVALWFWAALVVALWSGFDVEFVVEGAAVEAEELLLAL
jgi:hypothetical protein